MTHIEMLPPTTVHNDHIMIVRREGEGSTLVKLTSEDLIEIMKTLDGYVAKRFSAHYAAIVNDKDESKKE